MNQVVQDKMQREIMVVKNTALFCDISRESKVYTTSESDFESKILANYEYMIRGEAEVNFDYKQPITYAIVMNEQNDIFVYIRGDKNSNAWESRLHSNLAIGVWGHLEKEDEESKNPLRDCLERELEEEIGLKKTSIVESFPIGYINDERYEVGKVHIWVAYLVRVKDFEVKMEDGELASGGFQTYAKLKEMIASRNYDVEGWTDLLAPEIEKYI